MEIEKEGGIGGGPISELITGIGDKPKYIIPHYQRRYAWEKRNWEHMWQDIKELKENEYHFLSTLVFIRRPTSPGEQTKYEIVDGQQRITTLSIILCALRKSYEDAKKNENQEGILEELNNRIKDIDSCLWLMNRDNKKKGLRLELGNLDHKSYENLVNSISDDIDNELIKGAYDFFYNEFKGLSSLEEIKKFHDRLLDKVTYVSITANKENANAYNLFETLNNRGLSLSPIDLIKNYLFRVALEKESTERDRIKDTWAKIIQNLDKIDEIRFFRQYLMSSKKFPKKEKVTENRLYPYFKEIIKQSDIEELLIDIKTASSRYKKIVNYEIDFFNSTMNSRVNDKLKDLSVISDTGFTLLLRAFNELGNERKDAEKIIDIIDVINTLLLRRQICNKSTGEHDTFFNHLSQNAFEKSDSFEYIKNYLLKSDRFPEDKEFKVHFGKYKLPSNDRTRYILATIEEEYYGKGKGKRVKDRYEVHIEHILPQRLGKKSKGWRDYFTEEEHTEYKNRIGNLTLLESKPNVEAGNNLFDVKKELYAPDKTAMLMTHEIFENYTKWDKIEIEKRSEELARIATKIW